MNSFQAPEQSEISTLKSVLNTSPQVSDVESFGNSTKPMQNRCSLNRTGSMVSVSEPRNVEVNYMNLAQNTTNSSNVIKRPRFLSSDLWRSSMERHLSVAAGYKWPMLGKVLLPLSNCILKLQRKLWVLFLFFTTDESNSRILRLLIQGSVIQCSVFMINDTEFSHQWY